ncbi:MULTISPECIES: hypothetical protein [Rhizobium]|uniref:hypothetical protein n=1 Tax=Rhizobium TaxID=379 RepID=UPI0012E7EF59|nr:MULTISPECIES: hypothetical protein [Rhizobium]MBY3130069.1 hypothetical protein [Rhizobium laguerreae]
MTPIAKRTTNPSDGTGPLQPSDMFTAGYLRHLDFCIDVGFAARAQKVTEVLSKYDLSGLPELAKIMDRAREWLPGALRSEAINGNGSILDVNHPRYVEVSERAALKKALKTEPVAH